VVVRRNFRDNWCTKTRHTEPIKANGTRRKLTHYYWEGMYNDIGTYFFGKVRKRVVLSEDHKRKRLEKVEEWLTRTLGWQKVIFTDERHFKCDGTDSWCSWIEEGKPIVRN